MQHNGVCNETIRRQEVTETARAIIIHMLENQDPSRHD
jgi:hypothetical protein